MSRSESWASSPAARAKMLGNRGRDTAPELAVRRLIHARGLRYRVDAKPLTGLNRRADIVFPRQQVAVFIDGCFWHGCPKHGRTPSTNMEYWSGKIRTNVARDGDTNRRLTEAGWVVLRFWEHTDADEVASEIEAIVMSRR